MMRIVTLLLVSLLLCPGISTAADRTTADVLSALQATRATLLAAETSGGGVAEGDGIESTRRTGTDLADKAVKVVFKFDQIRSVAQDFCPPNAKDPVISIFINGETKYSFVRMPGRTNAIMVDKIFRNEDVDPDPSSWSVEGFASLPEFADDVAFFAFISAPPKEDTVTVSQSNGSMTIHYTRLAALGRGTNTQSVTYCFDMSLGGMMTSFHSHNAIKIGNQEKIFDSVQELEWIRKDAQIVPKLRRVRASRTMNGIVDSHFASSIIISQFTLGNVVPTQVSLSALKVPDGLTVIDTDSGTHGKYFDGYFGVDQNDAKTKK